MLYGAERSTKVAKNKGLVQDFANYLKIIPIFNSLEIYATQKAQLRTDGNMISDFDILIAATAKVNQLIMVTENVKDFKRISEMDIENWVIRT